MAWAIFEKYHPIVERPPRRFGGLKDTLRVRWILANVLDSDCLCSGIAVLVTRKLPF